MIRVMKMWIVFIGALAMAGCSSPAKQAKPAAASTAQTSQSSNPYAKYLELSPDGKNSDEVKRRLAKLPNSSPKN